MSVLTARQATPRLNERTPEDWRRILWDRLALQRERAELYEAYYDGAHPMQFATAKFREAFGYLFSAFADNWCQIVVDAPVERLKVVGFRVTDDVNSDAWDIWQANALDVEQVIAHTEAGKCGHAFLLVDPNDGEPRITVEHPCQVIVATDPGDRRKRLAALKAWLGEDGYQYLTLYLPDRVWRFESKERVATLSGSTALDWVPRRDEPADAPNPFGVVPVVPMLNKPGLMGVAHSDLEPAIPLQNAINKLCTDLIVTSEYAGFPQRVLTGVEVPKDPTTGQPIASDELKAAMSRLWTFKPPDAKVTQLPAADLSNFVNAVEMFVQHLAAQTRTPPHYLLAKLVNMSGDALQVAEAGLVSKCRTKQLFFSDPWEEAIALALSLGGAKVEPADCEAIWESPERVQLTQLVDAEVKKKALAVPLEVLWLELGYTPEQIAEMKAQVESDAESALQAAALPEQAVAREQVVAPGDAAPPDVTSQQLPPAAPPPGV